MPKLRKPARWAITRGLIEPKWNWFWPDLFYELPFWGPGLPYDIKQRKFLTAVGPPNFGPAIGGGAWSFDGSTEYFKHPDRTFSRHLAKHTTTFIFNTTDTAQIQTLWGVFNDGTNTAVRLLLNADDNGILSDGKINFIVRATGGPSQLGGGSISATNLNDGEDHIITMIVDKALGSSDGIIIILDGIKVPLAYNSGGTAVDFAANFEYDPGIGVQNARDSFSKFFLGDIYYAPFHKTNLTVAQVQQLHRDPYGPFRRFDDAALFAVGGDINTAEKRRSVSGIWIPLIAGVTPNAAKDQEWRQEAGWSYSGVLAAGAAAPSGIGAQALAAFLQSSVGIMQPAGVGVQLLVAPLQTGTGEQKFTTTGAQLLADLLQTGTGLMHPSGVGAQLLAQFLQAATGEQKFTATGAQLLADLLQTGTGLMHPDGAGAQLLAQLLQTGTGIHTIVATGTGVQLLADPLQLGTGLMHPDGAGAQLLANLLQAGSGEQIFKTTGAQLLADLLQTGSGEHKFTGTGVQLLSDLLQSGTGLMHPEGASAQLLANLLQASTATSTIVATSTGTQLLANLLQFGVGLMHPTGAGAQLLAQLLQVGNGVEKFTAMGAQLLANLLQAGTGVEKFTTTGAQFLADPLQLGTGLMHPDGVGAQLLAASLQSGAGLLQPSGVSAQLLANLLQAGAGSALTGGVGSGSQLLQALNQLGLTIVISQVSGFIVVRLAASVPVRYTADVIARLSGDVTIPLSGDVGV